MPLALTANVRTVVSFGAERFVTSVALPLGELCSIFMRLQQDACFVTLVRRELLAARFAPDDDLLSTVSAVSRTPTLTMPCLLLNSRRELGRNFFGLPTGF